MIVWKGEVLFADAYDWFLAISDSFRQFLPKFYSFHTLTYPKYLSSGDRSLFHDSFNYVYPFSFICNVNKSFLDVSVASVHSQSNSFRMLIETSFVFNYADNWIYFYSKPCFLKKYIQKGKDSGLFFAELCIQKWLFPTELHVIEWIKTVCCFHLPKININSY